MFNDFLEVLKENHFEEKPVDAKTFVESSDYLGQPPLSPVQYDIVEAMSQIFKKERAVLRQSGNKKDAVRLFERFL